MRLIAETKGEIAIVPLCEALEISRATLYRHLSVGNLPEKMEEAEGSRLPHPRSLKAEERQQVLDCFHSERFKDSSPAQVYCTLLDEGRYLCSERTMYRILTSVGENQERRSITRHGQFQRPELLATGPNQVWSWDITRLKGPEKWNYFYLYVILDIFSRYVVGWMVADRENGHYAKVLIEECLKKQKVPNGQLTIHSDRGSPMKSQPVGFLLADLGVTKSFGRPQVSNDNPFSEAQFKTLKYCPEFPQRFGSLEDAKAFCRSFFTWYNTQHRHSGIGYYTPEDVHYGRALVLERNRNQILREAYGKTPERFVRKIPKARPVPEAVWINPPVKAQGDDENPGGNSSSWPAGQKGPSALIPAPSAEAEGPSRARALALVAEGEEPLDGPVSGGHLGVLENVPELFFGEKEKTTL